MSWQRAMTEQQRRGRAEFIRDEPALWFALLYAAGFLGCSAVIDLMAWLSGSGVSGACRYFLPLALAVPFWLGLRSWVGRVIRARKGAADAPQAGMKN